MSQHFTLYFSKTLLILALIIGTCSCKESSDGPSTPVSADRTVLVYMAANCDLGRDGYDSMDLDEMRDGAKTANLDGNHGRLLVYHAPFRKDPQLKEVTSSGITVLKTYDTSESSIDISRMREVIDDVKSLAPNDSYGLVLWSHGTSFREESGSRSTPLRSFGYDNGSYMKITSLARALDGHYFDFIYADVCHFATVEVAYELRHSTSYLVGSVTELDKLGMPYDRNVPEFFRSPEADLKAAAYNTVQYYIDHPRLGCSMSVIATEPLDRLASATKAIVSSGVRLPADYRPIAYYQVSVPCLVYDFGHYIHGLSPEANLLDTWDQAYAQSVVYHRSTDVSFSFDMSRFTGMGAFILRSESDATTNGYNNQSWYRDVMSHMF